MRWRLASILRWSRNRIFLRVFGILAGLFLATALFYGFLIIPLQRDSLLKVLYSQADTVSRSVIQATSDAMLTDDFGFVVEHNLQVLRNNRTIRDVMIASRNGTPILVAPTGWRLLDASDPAIAKAFSATEPSGILTSHDNQSVYRYVTPIRFAGVSWGAMQIDFDTREYEANIADMYRQLAYTTIIALLAVLPVGYVFAFWLTRPIAMISSAASKVADGKLETRVNIDRKDEIGDLSRSFNRMVDALQAGQVRLRNYNLELEAKVAERTSALDELNRTLDQRVRDEVAKRKEHEELLIRQSRLAAMGEMIGAIAHQWRQPLNALSLVIQNFAMQYRLGTLTDESTARMEGKANQLIGRMSATIDEFRDFFKPTRHNEAFNLADAIASASDIMEGAFQSHNIRLTLDCDSDISLVGIPGEFAQVVLNLLSNAKDALLETRPDNPRIWVNVEKDHQMVRIHVEDNGGGIADDILDRIFDPYFTTKEEGKGTGIGLYMSKMIIERNMQGVLDVSNTAFGARFSISLPLQPKA